MKKIRLCGCYEVKKVNQPILELTPSLVYSSSVIRGCSFYCRTMLSLSLWLLRGRPAAPRLFETLCYLLLESSTLEMLRWF